ncbi:MAG: molybdenum hydroxylase, partial [Negativicutes bacterium]|nr:molybdenum hydroxylase [Negativicutes bacterium]
RASVTGVFRGLVDIGEMVRAGQTVAMVGSQPVQATIDGLVRGLLADGLTVVPNFKVGDIDPRGCREYCFTVSDKARAIGGGVLEAIVGTGGRRRVTGN